MLRFRDGVSDRRERRLPDLLINSWFGAEENPSDLEPFGSRSLEILHFIQVTRVQAAVPKGHYHLNIGK
jgi:hypothetical protein